MIVVTANQFANLARKFPPTDKYRYAVPYSHLLRFLPKDRQPKILELGTGEKASFVKMMRRLMGPLVWLGTVDIRADFVAEAKDTADYAKVVDLGDEDQILKLATELSLGGNRPDMVIDDGSHFATQIHLSQSILYPTLNPGGIYVIEDLETNDKPKYHQGSQSRPVDILIKLVERVCKGRPFTDSPQYYFYQNFAAIIKAGGAYTRIDMEPPTSA